jgi:hypothetical protein
MRQGWVWWIAYNQRYLMLPEGRLRSIKESVPQLT